MRPVGLLDPKTNERPYAVLQLRQDDLAGSLYNIVGFQTNLRWGEQRRILRMIPGLENAEFMRYGMMHSNTYINSPALLQPTMQYRGRADLLFAGQIVGAFDAPRDKPSVEPVGMALSGSGIEPGTHVWFVGDADIDLECARSSGCIPVLVREAAPEPDEFVDYPPVLHVDSCMTLLKVVMNL